MCVYGFAVSVVANEDGIMILCILIDESVCNKAIDDLSVYHSLVHQISIDSTHIGMLFGQFKRFLGLDPRRHSLADDFFTCVVAEQTSDGIGIGQPEKLLNEIDCSTTYEFVLTKPFASID